MTNHRVWGGDQFSDHDNPGCQRRLLHLHRSSTLKLPQRFVFQPGKQMLNHGHSPFLGVGMQKGTYSKIMESSAKTKGKGCWKNCNQRSFRRNFGTFLWCLQLFRSNPTRPSILRTFGFGPRYLKTSWVSCWNRSRGQQKTWYLDVFSTR